MEAIDVPFEHPIRGGVVAQVGLITSQSMNGKRNIMAAEWAYQISYSPGYFAVHIGHSKITLANLLESQFFGISTVADDQGWIASLSGNSHGDEVDKISVLKDLGVRFREHEQTGVWTVVDSAVEMVLEVEHIRPIGDHSMVVGKVLWVERCNHEKKPLLYHLGKYFAIGEQLHKPDPERMAEFDRILEKHRFQTKTKP